MLTPKVSLREFRRFRRLMLFEHFQCIDGDCIFEYAIGKNENTPILFFDPFSAASSSTLNSFRITTTDHFQTYF